MHYWSTSDPKAIDSDKSCIICNKQKMNWDRYARHLEGSHFLYMMEDNPEYLELSEVIDSWEGWNEELSRNPPSPDPRYYDSEKQCAISDFTLNPRKKVIVMNHQSLFHSQKKEEALHPLKFLQILKIPRAILALSQTNPESKSARNLKRVIIVSTKLTLTLAMLMVDSWALKTMWETFLKD